MALLRKMTYQKKALNHMEPVLMSIGVVLGAKSSTQSIGWLKLHITFCGKATDDKALERKITKDKALNHITSMVTSLAQCLVRNPPLNHTNAHSRTRPLQYPLVAVVLVFFVLFPFQKNRMHCLVNGWLGVVCTNGALDNAQTSPMSSAATHCNTLQYSATHCYTLQYTVTLCAIESDFIHKRALHHPQTSPISFLWLFNGKIRIVFKKQRLLPQEKRAFCPSQKSHPQKSLAYVCVAVSVEVRRVVCKDSCTHVMGREETRRTQTDKNVVRP